MNEQDTLLCSNKEDAKNAIDNIGSEYIEDWESLQNGKIKLFLKKGWKGKGNESKRISSSG